MTVILDTRHDINLDTLYRVAWRGEGVHLAPSALERIAACRLSFLDLVDNDPEAVIYGVTTGMGEFASLRLTPEQRDRHARIKPYAAATAFGEDLPERVVRGMVLARLANFVDGHAATSPRIAMAVAAMLDGAAPLPKVSAWGHGGAGEIQALYALFADLAAGVELEVRERGSLINGSPCAAALAGDAALAARRRLQTALSVFALSIEAFRAPLEHYDPALESLWGDSHEAAAMQGLRDLLAGGGDERRAYQAPVSYRIAPKLLGQAHRAVTAAERAATISLSSVSDNPVYLPPDEAHPRGRCFSTGGFHNALAAPALDDLAAVWADLCQLCLRHCVKLLDGRASHMPDMLLVGREDGASDGRGNVGYLPLALCGYIEQARAAAQTTLIPSSEAGGVGQDDVGAPAFLAFNREADAARCLDASLAMLAVIASQALHVTARPAPPRLRGFLDWVRAVLRPVDDDRVLGPELADLAQAFTDQAFAVDRPLEQAVA